ncbi:fimbria/pilus periplasmic chaperone [Yokenella regensburgei]|uniref:fimbrial biogenesis chaperone n=1 Tax=Yokenella regensburgei TaxID=158877 RepID=UPI003F174888
MDYQTMKFCGLIVAASLMVAAPLRAGVVLSETRVIYPAEKHEVTVGLKNTGSQAVLVQSWLDAGDPLADPGKRFVPLVVMPPVQRIDGGKGQRLRITYIGGTLPGDRESVFWLNVLAVPPKIKDVEHQYLNIAYQTRVKLFYRPVNLNIKAEEAVQKLQWNKTAGGLTVSNPTPYYISLLNIDVLPAGQTLSVRGEMVAPYGKLLLTNNVKMTDVKTVNYTVIDDSGRARNFSAAVD